MTPGDNWQDALSALRSSLPEGEEPAAEPQTPAAKPRLQIMLSRKGRRGKEATLIVGFDPDDSEVERIATALKTTLGVGGSTRAGEILIQGDRRLQCQQWLTAHGYTTINS